MRWASFFLVLYFLCFYYASSRPPPIASNARSKPSPSPPAHPFAQSVRFQDLVAEPFPRRGSLEK